MEPNERELLRKAQENANWMFDEREIAILCNVSHVIVGRVASAPDSPFFLNKCRPEWFVEWMRRHADYESTETPQKGLSKGTPRDSTGANPWADARRAGGGQRER